MQFTLFSNIGDININHKINRIVIDPVDTVCIDLKPQVATGFIRCLKGEMNTFSPAHPRKVLKIYSSVFFRVYIGKTESQTFLLAAIEEIPETFIGSKKAEAFFIDLKPCNKTRKIVISDGLFLLHPDLVVDICDDSVGNLVTVYVLV